ncbi:MAG: glycosyltransferase family 2 protein, partial [Desulfobacterales bacterium]
MSEKVQPLVSVVTPVYNGEKYLAECIESVLSQSYQNWEYIIVNNCSSDCTLEIAETYASKDKRIKIYTNDELLPIMKNWNSALHKISTQSKYCKVVHADDLLFPNCLDRMVSLAKTYPAAGVIGSYGLWGNRVVCDGLPYSENFFSGKDICRLRLMDKVNVFWSPSSLLISSGLIRDCDRFYNEKILHADVEACYEILQKSDFAFVHQLLIFIRRHDESVSNKVAAPYNRFLLSNLDLFTRYGPIYLSPDEYQRHLKVKFDKYYNFLA